MQAIAEPPVRPSSVARRAAGSTLAPGLDKLFREYAPRVYNTARRMLGNAEDAEDVTQDVFLHLLTALPTFRGEAALSTWLYRVVVNAVLAFRRRRAVRERHRVHDPLDDFPANGTCRRTMQRWVADPEKVVLEQEAIQVIEEAIAHLPEVYRDVYVLADIEGLNNGAVADLLGLSVPAVKSRLHRARLMMRDALAAYFEDQAA